MPRAPFNTPETLSSTDSSPSVSPRNNTVPTLNTYLDEDVEFEHLDFDREDQLADMENPASVQAMLADIFVDKCGHFMRNIKYPQ